MQICTSNIISLYLTFYCVVFLSFPCKFCRFFFFLKTCCWTYLFVLLIHVSMNLNTNPCPSKELNIPYHNVTFLAVLCHYLASNEVLSLIHLLSWRLLEMPSGVGDCHYCPVILIQRPQRYICCVKPGWLSGACSHPISWLWCWHLLLPVADASCHKSSLSDVGSWCDKSGEAAAVLKLLW